MFVCRTNELKLVLTMPGPDKMRPDEADDLIAQLLKKYDTNNDKKFSYGGRELNFYLCLSSVSLWLPFSSFLSVNVSLALAGYLSSSLFLSVSLPLAGFLSLPLSQMSCSLSLAIYLPRLSPYKSLFFSLWMSLSPSISQPLALPATTPRTHFQ